MAQHVDLLVDRCRLGDISVADRNVSLRLVIIVIGDEVLDSVLGEELAQLVAELRRKRFVVGQHQRRPTRLGDDVGHRERLTRACRSKQRLITLSVVQSLNELINGRRLVALWRIRSRQVVCGHRCCRAKRQTTIIAEQEDEVLRLPEL